MEDILEYVRYLSAISFQDLLVFAVFLFTVWWFIIRRRSRNAAPKFHHLPLPPSPPGLPLFGNMFSLRTNMRPILTKWTRELGGIFNIRIGSSNMIVISDADVMQEAFVEKSDTFSGRPIVPLIEISIGSKGMRVLTVN